jgi:hypothetical protein
MKLGGLLRHLRRHGCVLRRDGKEHELWENPQTGHAYITAVWPERASAGVPNYASAEIALGPARRSCTADRSIMEAV